MNPVQLGAGAADPLEVALRDLALPAPAEVKAGALVRVGLADEWAELPSPLGPIGVAWNGCGVSWIDRADEPGAFGSSSFARASAPSYR